MSILDEMENVALATMAGIEFLRMIDDCSIESDPETDALMLQYGGRSSCEELISQIEYINQLEYLSQLELQRRLEIERRLEQMKLLEQYKQREVAEKLARMRKHINFIDKMEEIDSKVFLEIYSYFDEITGVYCIRNVKTDKSYVGQNVKVLGRVAEHLVGEGNDSVFLSHTLGDGVMIRILPLSRSKLDSLDALEGAWLRGIKATRIV